MTTYQWIRSRTYIFNKIYSVMCRYINNQEMVFFIRFEKKCFVCCFDMSQTILLNLIKESQFTFYGLLSPICFLDYRKCACYLFSGHGRISFSLPYNITSYPVYKFPLKFTCIFRNFWMLFNSVCGWDFMKLKWKIFLLC